MRMILDGWHFGAWIPLSTFLFQCLVLEPAPCWEQMSPHQLRREGDLYSPSSIWIVESHQFGWSVLFCKMLGGSWKSLENPKGLKPTKTVAGKLPSGADSPPLCHHKTWVGSQSEWRQVWVPTGGPSWTKPSWLGDFPSLLWTPIDIHWPMSNTCLALTCS